MAAFMRAARDGNLDEVREFLKGSIDINTRNAVSGSADVGCALTITFLCRHSAAWASAST